MPDIYATSDIHAPEYIHLLEKALEREKERIGKASLFILAGDIVSKGKYYYVAQVRRILLKYIKCPIIGVYGNEDYEEYESKYEELFPEVKWLNDEMLQMNLEGIQVTIIGTRGVLDEPTSWQRKHIPNIYEKYSKRLERIRMLLQEASGTIILVSHYAVTFKTLKGENPRIWPQMGSKRMEKIIAKYKPTIVIHGHSHKGILEKYVINGVRIYNVSLPARKHIVRISLEERPSLLSYL